jgi:beta-glucosidase
MKVISYQIKNGMIAMALFLAIASPSVGQKKQKGKEAQTAQAPQVKAYTEEEINQKVQALLSKMTVEEKVGQMTQVNLNVVLVNGYGNQDGKVDPALLEKAVVQYKVGSILNAINHAYDVPTWHNIIKQIQDATKKTPNQIPVVYGIDAIHGVTFTLESTLFPQNISIGATRNIELARRAGEITALETRASGIRWNFAPVLDVGRQPLWPRFPETYGEDTYLVKELGVASIKGMEGDDNLRKPTTVASCMKHYLGYSAPLSGKDRTPAYIPERQLREIYLPPFTAAVKAGSETIMINSSEINGIPVHGDKYLLTDVLRGELGFKGVAVSDWEDIIRLHTKHKVAATPKEAVRMGVMAGIDMSMVPHDYTFYEYLVELVKEGSVPMSRIDEACGRILALKYKTGLFDNAYPEAEAVANFKKPEYKQAALDAARESIVLLKNSGNVLPLQKGKKVLVTGPAADSKTALSGSWSYTWQGDEDKWYPKETKTLLGALKDKLGASNVKYTKGTRFERREFDIAATVDSAKNVDYVIVAVGEDAYAESPGVIDDLTLPDVQRKLVSELYKAGKPVILVLVEGRPRVIHDLVEGASAIVYAGIPGSQGAPAIADVLTGDYNPDGKLPFSYPAFTGDFLTYDHKYSDKVTELAPGRMGEGGYKPEWPFGHGLSYTTFQYSDLTLSSTTLKGDDKLKVSVNVKNSGAKAGKIAVELYTRDLFASVTPNSRRLRKFTKISLAPGQVQKVEFELDKSDLAFIGLDAKTFVTEPGEFEVIIGEYGKELKQIFNYQK